jgi:hypothetical protein
MLSHDLPETQEEKMSGSVHDHGKVGLEEQQKGV